MNNSTEIKIFFSNLKWLREKHGLTQRQMAKRLNTSLYTISKLEKGELPPRLSVEFLMTIYDVFGVHPKRLFSPLWQNTAISKEK